MGAAHHQPAQHPRPIIRDPRPGQEVRSEELGEDPGIDLVGLHLRLRDRPGLARVRHHHPPHERAQQRGDRVGVGRRLQRHLVIGFERRRPRSQVLGAHPDLPLVAAQAVFDDGDLSEPAMHIHADRSHHQLLSFWFEELAGRRDDRNGFALAAQSGQSLGRPSTNTTSQVKVYSGLPWLIPLQRPEPDPPTLREPAPSPSRQRCHTSTNAIESLNARFRKAAVRRGHFPTEQAALKVLFLTAIEKRKNRTNPTGRINGWKSILNTLTIHYHDRIDAVTN
jgi:hypothetical protein